MYTTNTIQQELKELGNRLGMTINSIVSSSSDSSLTMEVEFCIEGAGQCSKGSNVISLLDHKLSHLPINY